MGSKASILLREEEIEEIRNETGFSANQIVRLYSRFTALDKTGSGTLSREDFIRIPELVINPLGDRIVHAFFRDCAHDCVDDRINFRQFVRTLARFRPISNRDLSKNTHLNSREEKLRFAFKMYDINDDDKIHHNEILDVLHMMVGSNISEEQLIGIANRTLEEADRDRDNYITFDEFCKALENTDVEQTMSIRFLN